MFEKVLEKSQEWGSKDNMMYVVGATKAEMLSDIRKLFRIIFYWYQELVLKAEVCKK